MDTFLDILFFTNIALNVMYVAVATVYYGRLESSEEEEDDDC